MATWIALFRGINVGGKGILPMAKLRSNLESLKMRSVRTYIQSGNVVFESSARSSRTLEKKLGDSVENEFGFRPRILVLKRDDFREAVESNPFPEAESLPKTLHLFFLAESADQADLEKIEATKAPSEAYVLTDKVFYLHTPAGFRESKLASRVERLLGVATTARNYRTVDKLMSMVA